MVEERSGKRKEFQPLSASSFMLPTQQWRTYSNKNSIKNELIIFIYLGDMARR